MLRRPREHLVENQQHLPGRQRGPQPPQRGERRGGIGGPGLPHAVPVALGDALRRAPLPVGKAASTAALKAAGQPGWRRGRSTGTPRSRWPRVPRAQQIGGLALLQAADAGAVGAHQGPQRRRAEDLWLPDLPAQQAGGRGKGQILAEQTGLLLQAAGDDEALMGGQEVVAGHAVGPPIAVRQHLPAQLQRAEAAGHEQRRIAIGHHAARRVAGAVARDRLRIDLLPLQFHQPPQHPLADLATWASSVSRVTPDRPSTAGRSTRGEFGHRGLVSIINAANQQA